jgi:hypothetical protein
MKPKYRTYREISYGSKYEQAIDRESAYEMLTSRMEQAAQNPAPCKDKTVKEEPGMFEQVYRAGGKNFTNTLMREGAKPFLECLV